MATVWCADFCQVPGVPEALPLWLQVCVYTDQQQQPLWLVPGPTALMGYILLGDRWSIPILSLLPHSLGCLVGQSSHPQLGSPSHSLQHHFRSGIL